MNADDIRRFFPGLKDTVYLNTATMGVGCAAAQEALAIAADAWTRGRTIDHIGFEIRNLEAFCKQLEAKGIKFDTPYRDVPAIGLKIAYITDPWGTYIELTEGYDKY